MADFYLHDARANSRTRLAKLLSDLANAEEIADGKACVYATGSFGRLEAGASSDLDLFIVTDTSSPEREGGQRKRLLDGISEIKLKAELIDVAEKNGIQKFDAGGKYLSSHTIDSFTKWLGSDEDDYRNTLTGRMLMLLESKCLIGIQIYSKTIDQVISRYFRDFAGHEANFVPAFLTNDILRMWRTFCVNYEFYRKGGESREKLKNLKLKFSRMLTCFSGIIYLLAVYSRGQTVIPNDIKSMISITPTERLEAIASGGFWGDFGVPVDVGVTVQTALSEYSDFLSLTHLPTKKSVQMYTGDESAWKQKSYAFGESLSNLIDLLGGTSKGAAGMRRLILI